MLVCEGEAGSGNVTCSDSGSKTVKTKRGSGGRIEVIL